MRNTRTRIWLIICLQTVHIFNSSSCDKIYSRSIPWPQSQCNKPNWQDTAINYQKEKYILHLCVIWSSRSNIRDWTLEKSITNPYVEKEKQTDCFNTWFYNQVCKYQISRYWSSCWQLVLVPNLGTGTKLCLMLGVSFIQHIVYKRKPGSLRACIWDRGPHFRIRQVF